MKSRFYFTLGLLLFGLLGVSVNTVLAAPFIRVNPVWRPASQLSTIDVNANGATETGDDIRYVIMDIYVTVNVEFWAVGMVCTVNKAVLESFVEDGDPLGTDDNRAVFTQGSDWGATVSHFVDTIDTNGKINFAITTSVATNPPMGSNGIEKTLHIANLQFRVREDLLAAGTSPFTCTSNFLNRDGRVVLTAAYVAPPPLAVILGYNFSGNVKYQGIVPAVTNTQAIQITCDDADGDAIFDDVVTTANITTGAFSASNLRTQGRYDCFFTPNILNNATSPDAIHLRGQTDFNLRTAAFSLLPIILKNGNVETSSSPNGVSGFDTILVTSNWNAPASLLTAPYMFGDATGDRKVNEMDLAIIAGNMNRAEPFSSQHIIYSLSRDNLASFNNHLWLGEVNNASVQGFGAANERDYWPAVSPNGSRIAFIRNVGTNGADVFALFTAPITNGLVGTPVRISAPNATYDAFAPSWSLDGSQIAFVCSYGDAWADIANPWGNLCLIEAGGQNIRQLNAGTQSIRSKLQNPAWLDEENIYFAFAPDAANPVTSCDNRICMINIRVLSRSSLGLVSADMPYIRNTILGQTLLYRFDNGAGNFNIRFAQVSSSGSINGTYPSSNPSTLHEDIESGTFPNGTSVSTSVAYFTVSTGVDPDILFYEHNLTAGITGGITWSIRSFNGTLTAPNWITGGTFDYDLSNAISSPAFASGYNEPIPNTAVYLP